jgi:nicotinamide-nucleotide amidase
VTDRALREIELVTIGDELLLGFTIDTNAAYLARALADIGVTIVRRATVGDDAEAIAAVVREALDRTGAVVTTGGLGPTSDDRTKEAIGALFGRTMALDEEHLAWMRDRWRTRFGREMPDANRRQAMLPSGCVKLANNHGSAPGVWLEDDRGRWVAMLPGVPREMRGMLGDTLLPRLVDRVPPGRVVRSRTLRTVGVAESLIASRIDADRSGLEEVELAYLPGTEGVDLRVTVRDRSASDADALLASAIAALHRSVGDAVYGEGQVDLAAVVLDRCRAAGRTLAVAESCTGGMLGARLTAVAGSSDVVLGGVIAYHNDVKQQLLDVDAAALRDHGAVSEPVVRQMAAGVRARTGASIGLAITGVAGPGGGTEAKPVGTVWIAADVGGVVEARRLQLWGDREEVRVRACQAVLDLLRRALPGD